MKEIRNKKKETKAILATATTAPNQVKMQSLYKTCSSIRALRGLCPILDIPGGFPQGGFMSKS